MYVGRNLIRHPELYFNIRFIFEGLTTVHHIIYTELCSCRRLYSYIVYTVLWLYIYIIIQLYSCIFYIVYKVENGYNI